MGSADGNTGGLVSDLELKRVSPVSADELLNNVIFLETVMVRWISCHQVTAESETPSSKVNLLKG